MVIINDQFFILCDLVYKVQKTHAVNRDDSFKLHRHRYINTWKWILFFLTCNSHLVECNISVLPVCYNALKRYMLSENPY